MLAKCNESPSNYFIPSLFVCLEAGADLLSFGGSETGRMEAARHRRQDPPSRHHFETSSSLSSNVAFKMSSNAAGELEN